MKNKIIVLNLLNEDRQKVLRTHLILNFLGFGSAIMFIILASVGAILILSKFALTNTFNESVAQSALVTQEYGGVNTLIKQVNDKLTKIDQIEKQFDPWSEHLLNISRLIPEGIALSSLTMERRSRDLLLRGEARKREDLLSFKAALENSGMFESVESPISNILNKQDIAFDLKLKIKESVFTLFAE